MRISAVSQTHDAVDPVGFVVETAAGKVGVATDLGVATRLVRDRLKGCRVLVLEANHDEEMLRDGPVITSYSIHYTKLYDPRRSSGRRTTLPVASSARR